MRKLTKTEINNRLKAMASPIRVIGESNGVICPIKARCTIHKYEYEPYLGNLLKGCGCPKCKTTKLQNAEHPVDLNGFREKLLEVNPEYRIQYYNGMAKSCKVKCLKCGLARTDVARNFLVAPCKSCKVLRLESLKKDRTKAYRLELERRKLDRAEAYKNHIRKRLEECEHVTPVAEPYNRAGLWRIKAQCNYCDNVYIARVENLFAGTKCKKCSMRWAKNKEYLLGDKKVLVQGYEPQALDYLTNEVGIKPKHISVDKVPTLRYKWKGRIKRYYPDFWIEKKNTLVEVKSVMTLGLNSWYGRGQPPFEQNKEKHRTALAAGYKFKLIVVGARGGVKVLGSSWLNKTKDEVKSLLPFNG